MTKIKDSDADIFKGLKSLSELSFPKKCDTCGKVYQTVDEYTLATEEIGSASGLKESFDDDDKPTVELFRNCVCGSTLMDIFDNRRDLSQVGLKRREKFDELLVRLSEKGYDEDTVRGELLKIMRGEESIFTKK